MSRRIPAAERVTVTFVSATDTRGTRLRVRHGGGVWLRGFDHSASDAFAAAAADALGISVDRIERAYDDSASTPDRHVYRITPEREPEPAAEPEWITLGIARRTLSPAARDMAPADVLRQYAEVNGLTITEARIELHACQHPDDNHSTGIYKVWHGAAEPLILCGYHHSKLGPAMFAELRAAGVLS